NNAKSPRMAFAVRGLCRLRAGWAPAASRRDGRPGAAQFLGAGAFAAVMAFSSQMEPMSRALYSPCRTDWRAVRSFMDLLRSVDRRVTCTLSGISAPSTGAVDRI